MKRQTSPHKVYTSKREEQVFKSFLKVVLYITRPNKKWPLKNLSIKRKQTAHLEKFDFIFKAHSSKFHRSHLIVKLQK